ncbi:MAG: lamin tail domain-containing protein, partial [Myxococcota bacterium]
PDGVVDAGTLATAEVGDAAEVSADLAADALVRGENVLAVEVHQASPDDADLTFGCSLTARIAPASTEPTVVLNEIAPAGEAPFWVELLAVSAQDVGGLVLAGPGGETVLPAAEIAAGELFAVDDVGFPVESGDVLFLYSANRTALLDAARVGERARGRDGDAGPWRFPSEPTPGEPNVVELADDVVIHEIQYHHAPLSREGEPVTDDPEEWIELHNRGDAEVDLTGWQLVDAVAFAFPSGTVLAPGGFLVVAADAASLAAEHPGIAVVGDFSGRLDNGGDRVLLLDARGNPADEVRYVDGGRWPEAADGGGSSLELRDPRGDNAAAEAWAASDEGARAAWVTYRYRGVAEASEVGPDGVWNELVVGLLDAGEVLIDDVSVVRDPSTAAVELVEDGAFDGGGSWRLLGNHRHSEVVADPDDPSNPVLRLVATGPTGHVHNHAEITLPEAISAREYEISFRARWVSGSNQLHTRLYFNRLPRTTRVEAPTASGTPGEANSVAVENAGPTFADLAQEIAVPSPGEPVTIGVSVDDPDGVAAVTLWSAVAGGQFEAAPMTEAEPGRWEAALEGQEAGTIVQFFVEAEDARGATASFPAAGPDSRALVRFDDGEAATNGLHNLRILLTGADSDWLHADENLMSDDLVGATVVYDEAEVFHDVGVRLKGSERGRPEVPRLGYAVRFRDDQPFRGSHSSVLIDRSEGVGYGQREVLMNLVMTRAGSVHGEYNDLVHALTPLPEHTGPAELQLDRFSDLVLDAQFADGAAGTLFEYELVYYPLTTDDGTAEGQKLPQPDSVVGTSLTDLGDDPEAYRWTFLIQNNEREDDYDGILALCRTVGGDGFVAEADAVIDVEQWLRAFAFATLAGAVDNYGGDGAQHNARFYVRPEDGRVLYFPHDLDFFGGSTMAVVGNGDLARLLDDPDYARSYYGHLQDVVARAYDADSLAPWCAQLADLTGQDFDSHCQFVADRAEWVMNGSPDAVTARYPRVDFRITTNGGGDLAVDTSEIALEGEGWIDVRSIALGGVPLAVTWLDDATWRVTVPLDPGTNDVTLVAGDLHGEVVGTDTITVTSE